jgi:hypothetical protein
LLIGLWVRTSVQHAWMANGADEFIFIPFLLVERYEHRQLAM